MTSLSIGFAMTGSFCTYAKVFPVFEQLSQKFDRVIGIMSGCAAETDTRFGEAEAFVNRLWELSGGHVLTTIPEVEPVGPQKLLDVLVVAPCTGNTVAKLASGITDTTVTMACKSHLRNGRPLVLAIATNDGLGANAENIGKLLIRKNVFFVPFGQDDPVNKPNSLVADFTMMPEAVHAALEGRQLQPVLCFPHV